MRFAFAEPLIVHMEKRLLSLLFVICGPCFAQVQLTDAIASGPQQLANIMPDGSNDRYIGVEFATMPKYEGSSKSIWLLTLDAQAESSNGTFCTSMPFRAYTSLQCGDHLGQTPGIDYGPLLALGQSRSAFISPPNGIRGDWMPSAGGFFKYNLTDEIQLTTDLLVDFGQFHGGVLADLDVRKYTHVAPHQSVAVWGGITWGNRDFAQAQFGVTPSQSATDALAVYSPSAGVEDVHVGVNWRWDLSSAWMLTSGAYVTHLTGNVSGSPQVDKPNNASISIGLVRRF